MGRLPIIDKALGLCMNSKGLELELKVSRLSHHQNVPFLAYAKCLRDRGMGQVDVAWLQKSSDSLQLQVQEVKSQFGISPAQLKRLQKTCFFLGELLSLPVFLELVQEGRKTLPNFLAWPKL